MLTLGIDGGIMLIEVDNHFILMPRVMEVVACSTFLNYPSSESLSSSDHSRERVRVPHMTVT